MPPLNLIRIINAFTKLESVVNFFGILFNPSQLPRCPYVLAYLYTPFVQYITDFALLSPCYSSF